MNNKTEKIIDSWIKERFKLGDRIRVFDDSDCWYGVFDVAVDIVAFCFNDKQEYLTLVDYGYDNTYSDFDEYYIIWKLINGDLDYEKLEEK